MTDSGWSRPHWSRGETGAMVLYCVFGTFAAELRLDLAAHGGRGLPSGVTLQRIPKTRLAHWDGNPLRGTLGEILREDDPAAFTAARAAAECLLLRGELPDSESLAYLRDTLGVVAALLDAGGVAVVDPQVLGIHSAVSWRMRFAAATAAPPRAHVLILCHDEAGGGTWVKTRGMRKFARPDLSIRHVPAGDVERAGAVAGRLVELQARGMRFGDGSMIAVDGMPGGLHVMRAGALDDPDFNNVHLEITWPRVGPGA